jgi:hypothetical protein
MQFVKENMKTVYILKENDVVTSIESEQVIGSISCQADVEMLKSIKYFSCLYLQDDVLLYDKEKELPLLEADAKFAFNITQKQNRQIAYTQESDPIFMKYQRGEATKEEWEAKVAEIVARYPYQE